MNTPRDHLRLLLLQIREHTDVRREESASFCAYAGIAPSQLDVLNVFDTPEFDASVLEGYDALLVGGASEASVLEPDKYPFVPPAIGLLQDCIAQDFPVFASCFGFQLAVLAMGGRIVRDASDYEMGTPEILLTADAGDDPVFRDISKRFPAVSVHMERAPELPDKCRLLAYTDACPHAFRVAGKRFWAFQFHPEVDRATLVQRLTIYKKKYTDGDGHLDEVLRNAVETPESNALVRRFVDHVLL